MWRKARHQVNIKQLQLVEITIALILTFDKKIKRRNIFDKREKFHVNLNVVTLQNK